MPFNHRLVEAKIALKQVGYEQMPGLACDPLEAGYDGRAIRRLAALIQPTGLEVDEILPSFLSEAKLHLISPAEACIRLAVSLAEDILASNDDPLMHVGRFESWFMQAGYPREFEELGLIAEDVFVSQYTGMSDDDIRAWVTARLQAFLEVNRIARFARPSL